jgi:hypothetical protein
MSVAEHIYLTTIINDYEMAAWQFCLFVRREDKLLNKISSVRRFVN